MLDLTKPVRFIRCSGMICNIFPASKKGKYIVEYVDEEGQFFVTLANADELKNATDPKVLETTIFVHQYRDGEPYLTTGISAHYTHSARVTYTEGAENPWQIEAVK